MTARILLLSICFLAGSVLLANATHTEPTAIRESFSRFPIQIGEWNGHDVSIDKQVLDVLHVDDYVNRDYIANAGVIGLYIGFYQTQRQGTAIHSPLNCLPGAGWDPIQRSYLNIPVGAQNIEVNRITIQKGMSRLVVLYWYQAHGRIVASEYWGKFYSVVDAVRINRTDAALVRVVSRGSSSDADDESAAEASAVRFVQSMFPFLSRHLPD